MGNNNPEIIKDIHTILISLKNFKQVTTGDVNNILSLTRDTYYRFTT